MVLSTVVAALLGVFAARSIVAESDAHRNELTDRWLGPQCGRCSTALTATLATCRRQQHPQRRSNIVVLVGSTALSGALALALPSLWLLPGYLIFLWAMILLTITDLDTKLIPNRILGPAAIAGVVLLLAGHYLNEERGDLLVAAMGGVTYFAVMLLLALIVRGGLGFGDVKLSFLIGVFTGYLGVGHVVVAGLGSFLLGGLVALFLLATRRQSRKDAIAFGPFMTIAAIVSVFFGESIVAWYLR